jgi:uncharacterized RmlC-like cupin family protein
MIQAIKLPHSYVRDSGLWVRDLLPRNIVVPDINEVFTQSSLISFPPNQAGGNHKHPRVELFGLLSGSLDVLYIDEVGKQCVESMMLPTQDYINLYVIPAFLPHAVVNHSNTYSFMLEFATEEQHDIESVVLC